MQIPPIGSPARSNSPTPSSSPERNPKSPFSEENLPNDLTQIDCAGKDWAYKISQNHTAQRLQQLTPEKIYSAIDEAKLRKGMDVLISFLTTTCEYTLENFDNQAEDLSPIFGESTESFNKLIIKTNTQITNIISKLLGDGQKQNPDSVKDVKDNYIDCLINIFINYKCSLPSESIKVSLEFIDKLKGTTNLTNKFFEENTIQDHINTILTNIERMFYPPENNTKTLEDLLQDKPEGELTNLIGQLEFCIILLNLEGNMHSLNYETNQFQEELWSVIIDSLQTKGIIAKSLNTKSARNTGETKNEIPENPEPSPVQLLINRLLDLKADANGNYTIPKGLQLAIQNELSNDNKFVNKLFDQGTQQGLTNALLVQATQHLELVDNQTQAEPPERKNEIPENNE